MKITGTDRVVRNFARYASRMSSAMDAAVLQSAETVMTESKELCPVATGALRDSAVAASDVSDDVINAAVGYTASYALYVHERLDVTHVNGEAKFLEKALKSYETRYLPALKGSADQVRI